MVHRVAAATMPARLDLWNRVSLALAALLGSLGLHSDALPHRPSRLTPFPQLTLWAWERREDLHALNTRRFAVAYLDRTLTIGLTVEDQPRHNAVIFPSSAVRMPVVRIETGPASVLNSFNRDDLVRGLLHAADKPGIAALQIDFDASRSQREFYRDLLVNLRSRLPASIPVSITALASWCGYDDWLRGLPIDEAVPMMFRMEPDRRRTPPTADDFRIREPLCQSAIGVSTSEPWPSRFDGKRIYIFPDNGWRIDSIADLDRRLP